MNSAFAVALGLALLAASAPAVAQSINGSSQFVVPDTSVHAGIVIPFGHRGTSAERAPRLETWAGDERPRDIAELRLASGRNDGYRSPLHLGITLDRHPRMMLNGSEIPGQDDRHGISGLGWAGIGVGVGVLVTGGVVLYALSYQGRD